MALWVTGSFRGQPPEGLPGVLVYAGSNKLPAGRRRPTQGRSLTSCLWVLEIRIEPFLQELGDLFDVPLLHIFHELLQVCLGTRGASRIREQKCERASTLRASPRPVRVAFSHRL